MAKTNYWVKVEWQTCCCLSKFMNQEEVTNKRRRRSRLQGWKQVKRDSVKYVLEIKSQEDVWEDWVSLKWLKLVKGSLGIFGGIF
jgi:hypothetical protein